MILNKVNCSEESRQEQNKSGGGEKDARVLCLNYGLCTWDVLLRRVVCMGISNPRKHGTWSVRWSLIMGCMKCI